MPNPSTTLLQFHPASRLRPLGAMAVLGLLLLGTLACGVPEETRRAELQSRRDSEFTELCQQTGMVTPSYSQPRDDAHPLPGHRVQEASRNPQALESSSPR